MEGNTQKQLISKIQYKNFEPGEFTDRQNRTYEQTISLIEAFPWEGRKSPPGSRLLPTPPSPWKARISGDFLKLAVYYRG